MLASSMQIEFRLVLFTYLQTSGLSIRFVNHFQIHVEFRCHGCVHGVGNPLLDKAWQGRGNVQVGNRDANFTIVQFLQKFRVEFGQNGGSICYEKTTTTFSGLLKAHESSISRSALGGGFTVQTNVVTTQRRFVDLREIEREKDVKSADCHRWSPVFSLLSDT